MSGVTPITTTQFFIIFGCCAITIFACRVLPLLFLKGRALPRRLEQALRLIPPAAFAALVANDLFSPGMFDGGLWPGLMPLVAAVAVVLAARISRSLIVSVIVGLCAYGLLMMI